MLEGQQSLSATCESGIRAAIWKQVLTIDNAIVALKNRASISVRQRNPPLAACLSPGSPLNSRCFSPIQSIVSFVLPRSIVFRCAACRTSFILRADKTATARPREWSSIQFRLANALVEWFDIIQIVEIEKIKKSNLWFVCFQMIAVKIRKTPIWTRNGVFKRLEWSNYRWKPITATSGGVIVITCNEHERH